MNNYCRNCGEKLENNPLNCPKCNAEMFSERIDVEKQKVALEEFKSKEKKYVIIIGILFILPNVLAIFIPYSNNSISPLLLLCSLIVLVYAKTTMKNSTIINILFYIAIALIVCYFLSMIILIIACSAAINRCI